MTAAELAARTGICAGVISRYVNNLRRPSMENLVAMADVLFVTTDYLSGRTDDPADRLLLEKFAAASADDRRVIWTLLERYGGFPYEQT